MTSINVAYDKQTIMARNPRVRCQRHRAAAAEPRPADEYVRGFARRATSASH